MASDWIKVRTVLPTDGRLRVASRKCHVLPVTVFGALVTLWCLADSHADQNGELIGYTCEDIDAHVGVPGFCKSLPVDWIDASGEFVKLPQYQEHNGTTGKTRAQDSKRQKLSRSNRDKSVTREEKRREEEEQEQGAPTKRKDVTLPAWIEALQGADAIPAADPLFDWAQSVSLPREWIALAWWGFEARYADDAKKYTDWRAVFRRAVREDWLKLWRVDRDGSYSLTTAGEQLRREMA